MPKVDRDHELIVTLSKKPNKLVKSNEYVAPADPNITVRSWKMNEYKYYEVPSPFPTLARGLFTRWIPDDENTKSREGDRNGRYVIVARGYDKFFNIGEVPWTNWRALETHTTAPYHLTLKSNGCIIFIAALTPTKLVVTSKHSLGAVQGKAQSHAGVGERWLLKHLEDAGKTPEQLAQTLWERNETAVAELCDDDFEEHVLPIPPGMTGLHLHGLNTRTGAFQTRDPDEVEAFAKEWGFIPTAFETLQTVDEVRSFTEEVSKSGKFKGIPIEGFVVRTKIADSPDAPHSADEVLNADSNKTDKTGSRRDAPPYPPGSSFFFKVKFDEPYMMYRDWREITKAILSARSSGAEPKISKAKLNRPETKLYKDWVTKEIKRNPAAFKEYSSGHGIIATRERFLKWCEQGDNVDVAMSLEGKPGITADADVGVEKKDKKYGRKTIIVPIAIPGCGKTSIAVALKHLFGFGHTQSDDVKGKKPAPQFLKNVGNLLRTYEVVIADKNNHLVQHREQLREVASKVISPRARLVALNWSLDQPPAMIHRICGDRIQQRGENHQTLRADDTKSHEDVVWMFIEKTEDLSEKEVDDVIEMDIQEGIEENLARAVEGIVRILGLERPSEEKIKEALTIARNYAYTPEEEKKSVGKKKEKEFQPRYFGLIPEIDLKATVEAKMAELEPTHPARAFWEHIKRNNRITSRPHITIVHIKSLPQEQETWDKSMVLHKSATPPTFSFKLDHIVCNDRIMAIAIDELAPIIKEDADDNDGVEFMDTLSDGVKRRLHITVGTASKEVNPVEAKTMVEEWRQGAKMNAVPMGQKSQGRVKGLLS
ncbi:hypothetical protein M422DRAFT_26561 [Sphaerobolus stellatus SS14]|nr:hypothetical protein M422DRAFT_26561 [Sphaerobolus stellatus SS14]